jgi:hypothetical protein
MTRTIEIPLPEELLRLVEERARSAGLEREAYIRSVLSREVTGAPSLSEVLAPFRNQVTASGITDKELDQLFGQAREESDREKRSPNR